MNLKDKKLILLNEISVIYDCYNQYTKDNKKSHNRVMFTIDEVYTILKKIESYSEDTGLVNFTLVQRCMGELKKRDMKFFIKMLIEYGFIELEKKERRTGKKGGYIINVYKSISDPFINLIKDIKEFLNLCYSISKNNIITRNLNEIIIEFNNSINEFNIKNIINSVGLDINRQGKGKKRSNLNTLKFDLINSKNYIWRKNKPNIVYCIEDKVGYNIFDMIKNELNLSPYDTANRLGLLK